MFSDLQDSITFPGGNNRGSCIFAQTGVMTARSSRDGRRHTRFLRGNSEGFEVRVRAARGRGVGPGNHVLKCSFSFFNQVLFFYVAPPHVTIATIPQVCTIDHAKGGVIRLDATILYSDECEFNPDAPEGTVSGNQIGPVLGQHIAAVILNQNSMKPETFSKFN